MLAQERLYLTERRDRVVREGDARSAFLYAVPGDEIPQSAADRFGLVDGRLPEKPASKPRPASDASAQDGKQAAKPKGGAKEKAPAEDKEKSCESKEGGASSPVGDQGGGQAPDTGSDQSGSGADGQQGGGAQ